MLDRLGQVFRGNEPVAIAVELAVIWAAVFLMLRFLRGTRGAGVLKGVIVILAAVILALRLGGSGSETFARLRFVAEALAGTLAIALVVVFQPELRQALMRLGQSRWLGRGRVQLTETVPAIDEAVEFLSRNQFGALIVVERSVPLADMVRTGVPIDSAVSARLLESIFWPNSPLHDLAVVVVVSEQTGAIRIASDGGLSEPIAYDDFAAALRSALTAESDGSGTEGAVHA
jgi:diadenylate cyclase